ncbi:MAG: anhydro-N-acetylmuramic acid kinase [Phycisphaeraceae bacterium]|nr:anhydro-N-acetylmuramic acid kinase [Phycisphaeraceae bacterium]
MPRSVAQARDDGHSPRLRRVVGCMTGTSLDGIDCALVEIEGSGLSMKPRFVRGTSGSLGELAPRLRALADQKPMTAGEIAKLSRDFALLHAREVNALLDGEACDLIAVHGQTVFHQPPVSWQLFNPAVLAHATGIDVVCDLRAADLAAGGQGAPITPIADWVWLRSATERRVVLNLGGFANATILPRDAGPESIAQIRGMDICACNHVLDGVARAVLGKPYDADGAAAAAGRVDPAARDELMAILSRQASGERSLGTGDEAIGAGGWAERWRGRLNASDLCATACAAVGGAIRAALGRHDAVRVLVAGGGAMNNTLLSHIGSNVERTDGNGLPGAFREAAEMAVLGALCQDGVPITLPGVTHVPAAAPLSGVWAFAGVDRSLRRP